VYIECAQWPDLAGWEILREGKAGTVKFAVIRRASVDELEIDADTTQ
jgi:16S rRNA (guanine966-N2)-methyltransferase